MRRNHSNAWLFILLVCSSVVIYALQIVMFDRPWDTEFYLLQDLAFLPLQVALVTLVLGNYLKVRERYERMNKINMAIGAFFSEVGNPLLINMLQFCEKPDELSRQLGAMDNWTEKDFRRTLKNLSGLKLSVGCSGEGDLPALKEFLADKRGFMLAMLANPNLLEHDTFTDMLWAVFHLTDELIARESLSGLPNTDVRHLEGDIKRAIDTLIMQ